MKNKEANSIETLKQLSAVDIIAMFGGIRPMANKLGIAVSTVQGWKERNKIPDNRYEQILSVVEEEKLAEVEVQEKPILASEPKMATAAAAIASNENSTEKVYIYQNTANAFSRALLSVVTLLCLILAGVNFYLYDQIQGNKQLLDLVSGQENTNIVSALNSELDLIKAKQVEIESEMANLSIGQHLETDQTKLKARVDELQGDYERITRRILNHQEELSRSRTAFLKKVNDLDALLPKLNQYATKNTSHQPAAGLQSKQAEYLTLWLVTKNLKQKSINGGGFHQEYKILEQLSQSNSSISKLTDQLKSVSNLYFFSQAELKNVFLNKKKEIEESLLTSQNSSLEQNETAVLGGLVTIKDNNQSSVGSASPLAPFVKIEQELALNAFDKVSAYIDSLPQEYIYKKWLTNWSNDMLKQQSIIQNISQLEGHILKLLSDK